MRLRLIAKALMLFIISILFIMPAGDAWSWKTHSDIVDDVYYGLPVDVQQKLNINAMRDGSMIQMKNSKTSATTVTPKVMEKLKCG